MFSVPAAPALVAVPAGGEGHPHPAGDTCYDAPPPGIDRRPRFVDTCERMPEQMSMFDGGGKRKKRSGNGAPPPGDPVYMAIDQSFHLVALFGTALLAVV